MSHMGNSGGNPQGNPQGGANFDHTGGNRADRDIWNNPIKNADRSGGGDGGDNTGGQKKKTNDDNAGIDDEMIATIWDKIENKDDKNQQQPPNNQQPPPNADPNARMQEYLQKTGLTGVTLTDQEKEAASNGDFGPMLAKMNEQIVNAHVKALSGAKELVDSAVREASSKVRDQSVSYMMGQQNLNELQKALPIARNKAYAPVAQSVMQKFLDRGWDTEKAIKGTKAYFENINTTMNGGNTNRNANFSSGSSDEQKENNWIDVLSPKG